MKTNPHAVTHLTTIATPVQGPKPPYERLLLGIDQHAAHLRIVRILQASAKLLNTVTTSNERFVKNNTAATAWLGLDTHSKKCVHSNIHPPSRGAHSRSL